MKLKSKIKKHVLKIEMIIYLIIFFILIESLVTRQNEFILLHFLFQLNQLL